MTMKNRKRGRGHNAHASSRAGPGKRARPAERGRSAAVSGNPRTRFERYLTLARAAKDAIEREGYYQHADHYFRLMNARAA